MIVLIASELLEHNSVPESETENSEGIPNQSYEHHDGLGVELSPHNQGALSLI